MGFSWQPLWLSLKLATVTTGILFLIGVPLVYVVYFHLRRLNAVTKSIISMPLVLPPSVIGYYLLIALNPNGMIGQFFDQYFGIRLAFSFTGLVIGSVIFSLPFMVNPILSAVENLPKSYQEAAFVLGKSKWVTFQRVLLPNVKASVLVAIVMTFAHTIGEFGVVLIIGGNIPDKTRVASVAIYNEMEALNYQTADLYSVFLLIFSFLILMIVYWLQAHKKATVI